MSTDPAIVSVFIAYRQGDGDDPEGSECAEWLYDNLQGRTIAIDGKQARIDTYWDQVAPAVGDWREVWEGDLKTARAFVLVVSPSTAARRQPSDWLFEEIQWWLDNREVAPIIVNAGDHQNAPIPPIVKERHGYAQWVNWSADALDQERVAGRIVEGIVLAESGVRYQELERTMRLLHEAEVARLDALAALNKAESLRLEVEAKGDVELAALGRKYAAQMNSLAADAERLRARGPLRPAESFTGRPRPRPVFELEVLSKRDGSCLLVHYGTTEKRRFVLVDGGPPGNYREALLPRLDELRAQHAPGGSLELEALVSTQADDGESGGLKRMLAAMLRGEGPQVSIKRFWTNTFDPFDTYDPEQKPVMSALIVPHYAKALGLPVNAPFDRFVSQPRTGAPQVDLADGLRLTVLGPRGAFSEFWIREVARALHQKGRHPGGGARPPQVVETVSSPEIYLRPSPVRIPDVDPGSSQDESARNRTSFVLLLEFEGRRVLLTSDAGGDDIVAAAAQAGLLDRGDSVLLDLVSLPHYGSRRNVDPAFFATIKADRYLVQGAARHRLPNPSTLQMLIDSRADEEYELFFSQSKAGKEDYRRERDAVLAAARKTGRFTATWRDEEGPPLIIDLMARD